MILLVHSLHTTKYDNWYLLRMCVWHWMYRPSLPQLLGIVIQPTADHHLVPHSVSVTTPRSALQYHRCRNGTTAKCLGIRMYATPLYTWWQCHDRIWYTKNMVQKQVPNHKKKNMRATNTITLLIICRFPMVRVRNKNNTLSIVFFYKKTLNDRPNVLKRVLHKYIAHRSLIHRHQQYTMVSTNKCDRCYHHYVCIFLLVHIRTSSEPLPHKHMLVHR